METYTRRLSMVAERALTAGPVVTKAESVETGAAAEARSPPHPQHRLKSRAIVKTKRFRRKTQPRVAEETSADIPNEGPKESEVRPAMLKRQ
jgi:hypothetical protein